MQSITGITITMRTIRTKVYKFNELKEDIQAKVSEAYEYSKVWDQWWLDMYADAEEVGIIINSFDFYNGRIECEIYDETIAATKIILNHGENTTTYKIAKDYLEKKQVARKDEFARLYEWFKQAITDAYLLLLREEYYYLISKDGIAEFFEDNGFEFYEDGRKF